MDNKDRAPASGHHQPATPAEAFPVAMKALDVPPRTPPSGYPPPYAARVGRRERRQLGIRFGLTGFGVNLTRIAPGACSALRHAHTHEDEFVYILSGHPVLVTDQGETPLAPGMCAGFRAGTGDGHHLVNRSDADVVFIEVGDCHPDDCASYPDDDLQGGPGPDGEWRYLHKDGTPY